MTKTVNLIDVSGFVYRSFYALPDLMFNGEELGAVYGYCSAMLRLKNDFPDAMFIAAFDSSKKTFRNEIYDKYKSNRKDTPESLLSQIPKIKEVSGEFGFLIAEYKGFEADDIIATYAKIVKELKEYDVNVISSDKDLMQLIDEDNHLFMFDPIKNKYITQEDVVKKFGVTSDKVLDVLSLMGDSSDNIPGVPGIGPKTASALINEFGSLDNVINNLDKLSKNKKNEKLKENINFAILSKKLAELRFDVPVNFEFIKSEDKDLSGFFEKYGFKTLLSRINGNGNYHAVSSRVNFCGIKDVKDFSKDLYVFYDSKKDDIEIGFTDDNGVFNIIKEEKYDIDLYRSFFQKCKNNIITNDAKNLFKNFPNKINAIDVPVMSYCISGTKINHGILSMQNEYIGRLNVNNSEAIHDLYVILNEKLNREDDDLKTLFFNIENKLTKVLADMEVSGILVDIKYLRELDYYFEEKISNLAKEIYKIAGFEFNVASPKQVSYALFDKLNLPSSDKKKSTDIKNLAPILSLCDGIAGKIVKWREFSKLQNTYVKALISSADENNRVHTTYSQTVVNTGRLSSSEPNLQNIPKKTEEGRKIRASFIASVGCKLVSLDYSQMELRLLAHIAKVSKMKDAFLNKEDIHKSTASLIFGQNIEDITEDQRNTAKTINFGIIYGMGTYHLAERLGISGKEAGKIYDDFFKTYPEIKDYMKNSEETAKKYGYVKTVMGRKCFIPSINSGNANIRNFAVRQAINAPIQGSNSDIIKLAMIRIYEYIAENNMKSRMLLQIHDELVFDAYEDELETLINFAKNTMENIVKLDVPLTCDVKISNFLD